MHQTNQSPNKQLNQIQTPHSLNLLNQNPDISCQNSITELLGFYGLSDLDEIFLAALAQETPVLLIGTPGTAKTQLVLTLFDILGLNHAHYNAAMLSIDELIGYPVKMPNGKISYQPLPSSCWDKQAIFIDEISRCKPEVQNKFFSLIYEKKIYGIELPNLTYRWAAMNPPKLDNLDVPESFVTEGTYPLDAALADRFNYIIKFPNFYELNEEDRNKIIAISENKTYNEKVSWSIKSTLQKIKDNYHKIRSEYSNTFDKYLYLLAIKMAEIDLHLTTRRIRTIKDNIMWVLTASYVSNTGDLDLYKILYTTTLSSIPHRAYKEFDEEKLKLVVSHTIKLSGLKFDYKSVIYQQQSPIERIMLCIEGLKNNQIDLELFNEILDSTLHTIDPLQKACMITTGFNYLSKISGLTANIADKICFEFMKYTSSVRIKKEQDDGEITFEIRPSFKLIDEYICDYDVESMIESIMEKKLKSEKIKDTIMCSLFNYLCETQPEFSNEEDLNKLIEKYINTFIYCLERLKNIFQQN